MVRYRGAWRYTWMDGDVQGCMVMQRGIWWSIEVHGVINGCMFRGIW